MGLFTLLIGASAHADTLVKKPKFTILSTEQGLSQDTVNSMLIDRHGFLWLATEGGLNRYDGYQVEQIAGSNKQIQEMAVYQIFEDGEGQIWLSTDSAGVFVLDLNTSETTRVGEWKFANQPDWYQSASQFLKGSDGRIYIALNHQVVSVDPDSLDSRVEYQLASNLIDEEHMIRQIWLDGEALLVGTTNGLFAKLLGTEQTRQLDFHTSETVSADANNVKFLANFDQQTLWIGTVEGLYSLSLESLRASYSDEAQALDASVRITSLNIWHMAMNPEGGFYLGTNEGLFSFHPQHDQLQHIFHLTDSRYYITDNNVIEFVLDEAGNLWLGTSYDGALYWTPQSTRFTNVLNEETNTEALSDNDVWSFYQQDSDTLWVGSDNGLNHYNLVTGDIGSYLVNPDPKAVFSGSSIAQIFSAQDNELVLYTGEGFKRFDTNTQQILPFSTDNDAQKETLDSYFWGVARASDGDLWFVNEQGIYQFDPLTHEVQRSEVLSTQINPAMVETILGPLDGEEDILYIAEVGRLHKFNVRTQQLTLMHELPKMGMQHFVAADSLVIDQYNVLWVAYPGFGLFGLDADTWETRYFFDRTNLLPSNAIYGMQLDSDGNIWMSSHRGMLKFYPDNRHIQSFAYAEGLPMLEFNQGAHTQLSDGRMVYGSLKGMTLFDPQDFRTQEDTPFDVTITSIGLSSKLLTLPLENLARQTIDLSHQDVGLSISFSTLQFNHQANTLYAYHLDGAEKVEYPPTRDPNVIFPKLEPGDYTFEVKAFDPSSGRESAPVQVFIRVAHAPWSSPLAYLTYILLFLGAFALLWYRRALQSHRLMRAHQEALNSKNRLSMALMASNSNVWEWNASTDKVYAPRIEDELGHDILGSEVAFHQHLDLIHEQDKTLFESQWQDFMQNHEPGFDVTYRMRSKNGGWQWYRDVGSVISNGHKNGHLLVAGTYTNITESLATREKVRLFGEAFRHTRDWVCIFDQQHRPVAANQAFCESFGIDENAELEPQVRRTFRLNSEHNPRFWNKLLELGANDFWSGEEEFPGRDGKLRNVLINMSSIASLRSHGDVDYYLVIMSDISEQKEAEEELRRMANFDSLTGLPNRTLLLDRVRHGIDHAKRSDTSVGLFFIDLDRFKQVNDSLGHKAGDELLKVVAKRLTNLVQQDDTVARLGGDEFVVMVEHVTDAGKLSMLAKELIGILEDPIQLGNQTVSVSSSVGIALFPVDASSPDELLRNADLAMYHAKEQGRSNFQYFTEHMNRQAQDRLVLEHQLKKAHQNKRFVNYYQPIVSTKSNMVEGFELLMRWPVEDGMIPPDKFIPVAEELGLIEDMTWDALDRAMPLLSQWQKERPDIYLSVNLSARHFEREISIEHISKLLHLHQLPVSALRFEITESALMKDYERSHAYMEAMQKQGFVIALDDFGTGYSSLKYLKEFPIQVLKIDKSFVDDIGKDKSDEAIILTTLRMAESLGMYCIAEGIEDTHQIEFFKQQGCEFLQGYYFSKPVPDENTHALIKRVW